VKEEEPWTLTHTGYDNYSITFPSGGGIVIRFKEVDEAEAVKNVNKASVHLLLKREDRDLLRGLVQRDRRLWIPHEKLGYSPLKCS
jgi:hypothetical protein